MINREAVIKKVMVKLTKKPIEVYRLENNRGQGPFAADISFGGQWLGSPNLDTDPGFSAKSRREFDQTKHLYGFLSPEQAKKYFEDPKNPYAEGDWDRLLHHGFKLKKYRAKKIWKGNICFFLNLSQLENEDNFT